MVLYTIENVNGGGLFRYVSDLIKYLNVIKLHNKNDLLKINYNDILILNNFYFTDIDIDDVINFNIVIVVHDCYWLSDVIMKYFYNNDFPPVQTNYLIDVNINDNIKKLFNKAYKVICPSNFVYNIYSKFFDVHNFVVLNHIDYKINLNNFVVLKIYDSINIGVLHFPSKCKGIELITFLDNNVKFYKNYKINYLILNRDIPKYTEDDDLYYIVKKYNIHGTTLLNIWGETYCYTLTKLLNIGIPIIYNNIGSFTERIYDLHCEKYFSVFNNELCVYNYIQLENVFYNFLDYIILHNDVDIYEKNTEINNIDNYKNIFNN